MSIVNLSGHRPFQFDKKTGKWISKLEYTNDEGRLIKGNSRELYNRLVDLAEAYYRAHPEIEAVIGGCAMGWDLAGQRAAVNLGIPMHAYVPYVGHGQEWNTFYKEEHNELVSLASYIFAPDVSFSPAALLQRNRDMVDASDMTLALFDGSGGGTAHCVNYALSQGKPVVNLWPSWIKYRSG